MSWERKDWRREVIRAMSKKRVKETKTQTPRPGSVKSQRRYLKELQEEIGV